MMKKLTAIILYLLLCLSMAACGGQSSGKTGSGSDISPDLTYVDSMELTYAQEFSVDYFEGDYALITIDDDTRYLLVPEDAAVPGGLDEEIVILQQPLENIYLVASAVMDMFVSLDALDHIRFSGTEENDWYIEPAKEAMQRGDILYAGKYSAPDYEEIISEGCDFAIENTMIYHSPDVKEELESFDIPVLVDYSSYEPDPLGRTEWVKLYGLLVGEEEKAEEAFDAEDAAFEAIGNEEPTDETVAFFYITSNGEANVRQSYDYLPKMIEMAGGTYIFPDLGDEDSASSTISMQMEEFYAGAKDADFIIYNSTIEGELRSIDDLISKSEVLADFKAVQDNHVFCTTENLYQSSMSLGTFIADIHNMLIGDTSDLTYIYQLE